MFGSEILEVAIGLILVYLLLSLMCSVLNEWIARIFAMRSTDLEKTIQTLLADPEMAKTFYAHPLIKGLAQPGRSAKPRKPSYIPNRTFALVLMDIITHDGLAVSSKEIKDVRKAIADSKLGKDELKKALLTLVNAAQNDFDKSRKNIEDWYDEAMARLSGSYKRKTQVIILIMAFGISIFLNADTFTLANTLWSDNTLRASVVATAQETVKVPLPTSSNTSLTRIVELQAELDQLKLPFGWITSDKHIDPREAPGDPLGWFYKILGLLATAFALSLGAPFWFDTLNKFVNLRGVGKPPAETGVVSEEKNKPS